MQIARFIREHLEHILDEWDEFARGMVGAGGLDAAVLRDHAAGILTTIARDLEQTQTPEQGERKAKGGGPPVSPDSEASRHDADRVVEGFSVSDIMSEFRALSASVVRLWQAEQKGEPSAPELELTRFNEAIDQALTDSLLGSSRDRERRERLFDTLLSASPDLSFIVDPDTCLVYANAALAREFEMPLSTMRGKPYRDIARQRTDGFDEDVRQVARSARTVVGELSNVRRARRRTYEYLLVPVANREGQVEAVAGIARDVTERKAVEEKYKRSAQFDELTGLPNRYLFSDRLAHEIRRADRIGQPLALMFIDLDGFKQVNDLLGHLAGDELLRQGAARIRACVREIDTVARLGGDEFTVILSDIRHMPHIHVLAQHILDELAREFLIEGRKVNISASIGIALYPQHSAGKAGLLQHADQAMYAAKQSGRNQYRMFTREMHEAAWRHSQQLDELRQALRERQFQVLYEPIVELGGAAVVGAEAQLVWQHPARGRLAAQEFADLADEAGLGCELGELLLGDALDNAGHWRQRRTVALEVSIDHSSLAWSGKAIEQLSKLMAERIRTATAPVALEVTEAMLLSAASGNRALLHQLTRAGVPLSLDDFGTGYSALSVLTMYPLVSLRIASPLVRSLDAEGPRCVASGIIASGHALGLTIIAQGVETQEQRDRLQALACDYAQGPYFFAPIDAPAFSALL